MSLPLFYLDDIEASGSLQILPEDASRHIIQVLRMKTGESLRLTYGQGKVAEATITDDHKKHCAVSITGVHTYDKPAQQHTIAISLLKNTTRFEWFLEKAAELGITRVVPLICHRTEKAHFRKERMKTILTSAMLQSQQSWLTELTEPVKFQKFIDPAENKTINGFIAHCEPGTRVGLAEALTLSGSSATILIGPEGDFSTEEISLAMTNGYRAVSLGNTRLRTETAGIVAATLLQTAHRVKTSQV